MAQIKIKSKPKFQVLSHSFSVSPSTNDYNLCFSADGLIWCDYKDDEGEPIQIPAGEVLIVTDCAYGQYIFLDGYFPMDPDGNETEFGNLIY